MQVEQRVELRAAELEFVVVIITAQEPARHLGVDFHPVARGGVDNLVARVAQELEAQARDRAVTG